MSEETFVGTMPVQDKHRFDEAALANLAARKTTGKVILHP